MSNNDHPKYIFSATPEFKARQKELSSEAVASVPESDLIDCDHYVISEERLRQVVREEIDGRSSVPAGPSGNAKGALKTICLALIAMTIFALAILPYIPKYENNPSIDQSTGVFVEKSECPAANPVSESMVEQATCTAEPSDVILEADKDNHVGEQHMTEAESLEQP